MILILFIPQPIAPVKDFTDFIFLLPLSPRLSLHLLQLYLRLIFSAFSDRFMDKGWALTLDSSSSSLALLPSKQPNTSLNSFSKLSHKHNDIMFKGLGFPVNLSRSSREEHGPPAPSGDDRKVIVSEVDFFSDRTKSVPAHHQDDHHDLAKTNIGIKKENPHSEPVSKSKLDVNVSSVV